MLFNKSMLIGGAITMLLASSCSKEKQNPAASDNAVGTEEKIYTGPWANGSAPQPEATLNYGAGSFTNSTLDLTGALSGSQMLVSNQPEEVTSRGWVFRGSINDGDLGSLRGISGNFVFYLYHYLLGVVGSNTKAYLVARNVTASSVTVTGRGYYEVKQSSTDLSTSLRTARHWLNDKRTGTTQSGTTGPSANIQRLRSVSSTIPANSFAILDEVSAPNSQTIDGRYELSASNSVVVYLVFDNLDALTASAKLTQLSTIVGSNTNRATGTWRDANGYIVETGTPGPSVPASGMQVPTAQTRFGRECGIYLNDSWTGTTTVTLPTNIATLRLHYNTSVKSGGQEQCANAGTVTTASGTFRSTTPVDSRAFLGSDYSLFSSRPTNALRSYGNYGHTYDLTFNIVNTTGRQRRVQILVGRAGGARYYAPFWVSSAGFVSGNVNTTTDIVLDPGVPGGNVSEKPIADVVIGNNAPGASIRVRAVVPGSITIGQYLLVRTLD
jgi:hypothetical protein